LERIQEAVELIYEDESLAECCEDVLPKIEELLIELDKLLPKNLDAEFFLELANTIRVNLISNPDYKKRFLEGNMGVITVTYELGSNGLEIARKLGEKLNYKVVFSEILSEVAKRLGVPEWKVENFNEFKYVPSKLSLFDLFQLDKDLIDFGALFGEKKKEITFEEFREALIKTVTAFAVSNNVIIVGHAAACILQEYPNSFHLKVEAPFEDRVKTYSQNTGKSIEEAEKELRRIDEKEVLFYKDICGEDIREINLFHLKLNSSKVPVEAAVDISINAFKLLVEA